MIKILSREAWQIISKGKEYKFYCDLRLLIGCIDYLMEDKIYRVRIL